MGDRPASQAGIAGAAPEDKFHVFTSFYDNACNVRFLGCRFSQKYLFQNVCVCVIEREREREILLLW